MTLPQIGSRLFDSDRGDRGEVLVDGIKRPYIKRCCTGSKGWAVEYMKDNRGKWIVRGGEVKKRTIAGVVVFKPKVKE